MVVTDTKNAAQTIISGLSFIQTSFSRLTELIHKNGGRDRTATAQASARVAEAQELATALNSLLAQRGKSKDATNLEKEAGTLELLSAKLSELKEILVNQAQQQEWASKEMDQLNSEITDQVLQEFAEIQFQDRVSQQIEMVLGALSKEHELINECSESFDVNSKANLTLSIEAIIEGLREKYVMVSQHKLHAQVFNQGYKESTRSNVEIF
jgi:hypothetical protein